jgi:hypothetical protein
MPARPNAASPSATTRACSTWPAGAVRRRPRRARTAQPPGRAQPDSYELSSPKEYIAVNMEYFLLDPSYACRRPALYQY